MNYHTTYSVFVMIELVLVKKTDSSVSLALNLQKVIMVWCLKRVENVGRFQ